MKTKATTIPTLQGKSKDLALLLSIPIPVVTNFNIFESVKSVIRGLPEKITRRARQEATSRIQNYLSNLDTPQFLLSRKDTPETTSFRFHQTNPNGLCGAIALYQLRTRDQQSFVNTGHKFTTTAIDFNNPSSRDDFVKFLDEITLLISSKSQMEDCQRSLTEMKSWLSKTHGAGVQNPVSFPKSLWWDSSWYLSFQTTCSFIMFHGENDCDLNLSSREYLTALLSSESSSMSLFTFQQFKRMVKKPNYFQWNGISLSCF